MLSYSNPLHLLNAINRAQSCYIDNADPRQAFDRLLRDVLELTDSEYGFIGEVHHAADDAPFLKTYALTNIAWNAETLRFYEQHAPAGLEFTNLKTLFGAVLTTAEPVIANEPATDSRRGGLPADHPPLKAFLGLPVKHTEGFVAMLGLANRPEGYDQEIIHFLEPLLATIGQIVTHWRGQRARQAAEAQLQKERELFNRGPIMICTLQPAPGWPVMYISENVNPILGYTAQEMNLGTFQFTSLIYSQDRERARNELVNHLASGRTHFDQSCRLRTRSGAVRWFYMFFRLEHNAAGKLVRIHGYLFDQTGMLETEQYLTQERYRLAAVLEGTNIGVWEWSIQTGETVFNERWAEIAGYTLAELEPVSIQTWLNLVHPEDLQRSNTLLERHFRGELDHYECESRMRHKQGHWVWVLDRGRVMVRDDQQRPLLMYGTHQDISTWKQNEEALRTSEARFRSIFEKANTGMAFADAQGQVLFYNNMFAAFLEYDGDELLGMNFADFTHPNDREVELVFFHEIVAGQREDYRIEKRYITKTGTVRWGDLAVAVIRDIQGQPQNFVGLVVDVTERRQTEVALKESELRFRQFADNVGMVFWVRTRDRMLYINQAYERIWGRTCQSLQDHPVSFIESVHPDDRARVEAAFRQEVEQEKEFDEHYRIVRPNGDIRWIQARSYIVPVEPGQPVRWTGVAEDITARKQAEDALRESIERFSQVAEQSREMIWEVDAEGLYTYVSQASQTVVGYWPEELIGRLHFYDLHPETDREAFKTQTLAAFERRDTLTDLENLALTRDGRSVILLTNGVPIYDDTGGFAGYRGADMDITARKEAEAALRESERKFRGMFELSPVGIAMNDFNTGAFLEVNDALLRSTGYTRTEFLKLSYWDVTPREYEPQEQVQLESMRRTGYFGPYEKEYIRKNGARYPVLLNGMKLLDDTQKPIIWVFIQDITERKQAELALQEAGRHTRTILDNVIDGIVTIDEQGIVNSFNRAAEKVFGYQATEIIGQKVNLLMPEPHRSQHDTYLQNYLIRGVRKVIGMERELEGRRKDGSIFALELAVSEIARHGRPFFIAMLRDITERKRIERMKNEFISTVSHELRTPLTSISGSLGLLAGGKLGELSDKMRQMVDIAYNNSRRLNNLVNDLLDMEKITAGKMHFNMQPQNIMQVVNQSLEANRAYGLEHGSEFVLAAEVEDASVLADAQRLQQVLTNLLSNAAKFSPSQTQVEVAIQRLENHIRVAVTNQGPGIPREFEGRIFQKFSQVDSSDTRKKGGTGLGLAISRELTERMGGRVGFTSEPGRQTTFYIDLPEYKALKTIEAHARASRLLVVEDDSDIAYLLALLLHQNGFNVDVALNGRQALQFLEQQEYAAMTLDLKLPDMNGAAIIRHVRSQAALTDLPIIVVSAHLDEGRLAVKGEFNALHWLEKPVDESLLVAAVKSALPPAGTERPRVLHVEDDRDQTQIVSLLGEATARFDTARSLKEAHARLSEHNYRVVVLDLTLADGSGWELLPRLRAMRPRPRVIVLSATELMPEETAQVEAALVKSRASNRQLLDVLQELIGKEDAETI